MKLETGRKWVEVSASDREGVDGLTQVLTKLAKADADILGAPVFTGRDNALNARFTIVASIPVDTNVEELLQA